MTPHEQRPLLFLDVDGTLLPFGGNTQREPPGATADSRLEQLDPNWGSADRVAM
jgi:trehalose-6-phosphatase